MVCTAHVSLLVNPPNLVRLLRDGLRHPPERVAKQAHDHTHVRVHARPRLSESVPPIAGRGASAGGPLGPAAARSPGPLLPGP